jgi:tetratricopeptide (TPR) repeat protein
MKLTDILPSRDLRSLAQGLEVKLVRRKQTGILAAAIALSWAIIQLLLSAQANYVSRIGNLFQDLISGNWGNLTHDITPSEVIGTAVLIVGFGTYFLLNWTSFLLREAEGPFRYTFWIEPFSFVDESTESGLTKTTRRQLSLLHWDLIGKLTQRIRRLSLVDNESLHSPIIGAATALKSHIHIRGTYAIREDEPSRLVIQILVRIRIGPPGGAETLVDPIKYPLESGNGSESDCSLDVSSYKHILERTYFQVATEIYRLIDLNIKDKVDLFPTNYLRAVALLREAQDFADSHTIDAYVRAIDLYRQAQEHFNVANVPALTAFFIHLPYLWRCQFEFVHARAMVQMGLAQALIYQEKVGAYAGRRSGEPLFAVSHDLRGVIRSLIAIHNTMNCWRRRLWVSDRHGTLSAPTNTFANESRLNSRMELLKYPSDRWYTPLLQRPGQAQYQRHMQILFDCHVVAALVHFELGSKQRAKHYLDDAKATSPVPIEKSAMYLLAAGEIEPDREQAILFLRQATELVRDFEIAQFALAEKVESLFRLRDEFLEERSRVVMREYKQVLAINPANISALTRQGYLLWLLGDLDEAKRKFDNGCEQKTIVRETFVGELTYGMARIAAEKGFFSSSYDLYTQAVDADPGVGAHSVGAGSRTITPYYNDITLTILERYRAFAENVEGAISKLRKDTTTERTLDANGEEVSQRVLDVVHSFVLNDYGNACFNYFFHIGDLARLDDAILAFERARLNNPQSKIVPYNLHKAYLWRGREQDHVSAEQCLEGALKLGSTWPTALIALTQARLRNLQKDWLNSLEAADKQARAEDAAMETREKCASHESGASDGLLAGPIAIATEAKKDTDSRGGAAGQDSPAATPPEVREDYAARETPTSAPEFGGGLSGPQESTSAISLYEKADEARKKLLEEVRLGAQRVFSGTTLSPVYEGYKFDVEGNGIERLLSARVGPDRLREDDVRALRLWAQFLSNNLDSESALRAAERICSYILENHYPESFEVILIPFKMYKSETLNANRNRHRTLRTGLTPEVSESGDSARTDKERAKKLKAYAELLKPIVEDWADRDPTDYAVLAWVGDVFEHGGGKSTAIYDRAERLAPRNRSLQTFLGNVYLSSKAYDKAVNCYKKAIALEPNCAALWNSLGNTHFSSGACALAIDDYKKAVELEPKTVVYHWNLGSAYTKLSNWGGAEGAFKSALALEPTNAAFWNSLGNTHYFNGAYNLAIDDYKKAIELEPKTVVYHSNLGSAYTKLSNWEGAEAAFKSALALEPSSAVFLNSLGNTRYLSGAYNLAIDHYKKAIEREPKTVVYHSNLGNAYTKLSNWEGAEKAFTSALALEPSSAVFWNSLGNTHYSSGAYGKAIESYKKAIEFGPEIAVYQANLGLAFEKLKQWEDSKRAYLISLEIDPKNAGNWNSLGNVYYWSEAYVEARDSYAKAIALDPNTEVYQSNLEGALKKLEPVKVEYVAMVGSDPDMARPRAPE